MGRLLGSFDGDNELDRPDLNKCPDCECYFAQDNCPLCGKECPPEMRAGARKTVKKRRTHSQNGRVTFVEWYHSWWFIILMLFLFPVIGIILLITSPHKRSAKAGFVCVGLAYMLVSSIGLGNIIPIFVNTFDPPVNTKLSFEEYTAKCVEVDAEDYFREPDKYKGQYIKMTLTVLDSYTEYDCKYGDKYSKLYSCDGGNYAYIIIRDCTQSSRINLKYGDIITIYGEGAGNYTVDGYWNNTSYPCIHVAYVTTIEKTGS
jgi:hypothetical protein